MKSPEHQRLIDQATRKAYNNATDWMRSDPAIAAQLRDGLRTTIEAFDAIEAEADTPDAVLLGRMLAVVEEVLRYYQGLPGSQGEWECSAVGIVKREIIDLIDRTDNSEVEP
jgi:hypothetical protein